MTTLVWDKVDERRYEVGVSHGVFYPIGEPGVVWNGLTSVVEGYVGGEQASYHMDGIKYLDFVGSKDYQATITAFQIPKEFLVCMGEKALVAGIRFDKQPKQKFHFTYRSEVENGYKLHLVYNVLATLVARGYNTEANTPVPTLFSWIFNAVPVVAAGFKASSHYIVDSTKTDVEVMSLLEELLYGTTETDPEFPVVDDLVAMFV